MQGAPIPAVDEAISAVRRHQAAGRGRVALIGPAASGKSTTLRQLAVEERAQKHAVVELSFREHRDDDAAVVALADAAAQLGAEVLGKLRDPRIRFDDKIGVVVGALNEKKAFVTIDASGLYRSPRVTDDQFRRHSWTALQRLSHAADRVVVAIDDPGTLVDFVPHRLTPKNATEQSLAPAQWNGLGKAAGQLSSAAPPWLKWLSPLQLRLAVGAIHLEVDLLTSFRGPPRTVDLVRVMESRLGAKLRTLLGVLGHVRVGFTSDLLDTLGRSELGPDDRKLLEDVFLYADESGEHFLHESIAVVVASERGTPAAINAHEKLAGWHRRRFEAATKEDDVRTSTRATMEAVHHLTEAGSFDVLEQAWFVEQLDALGKSLSLQRRYADAVSAYDRAIELDAKDSYAFHYRAYNRDVPGERPDLVETDYREAIRLDDEAGDVNLWHRQRLAYFLLTDAREREARDVFLQAMRDLGGDSIRDAEVFRQLHRPLAHLAAHRGQLDLAEEILLSIPSDLRSDCPWLVPLTEIVVGIRDAKAQRLVFPPAIPIERRWQGPHLFTPTEVENWCPGRVEHADSTGTTFRIAQYTDGQERLGHLTLTQSELFHAAGPATFPAGTFVEIATTRRGHKRVIRGWSPVERVRALPPLFPRPDRYLGELARAAS